MDQPFLNEVMAYVAIIITKPMLTAFLSLTVGWMLVKFILKSMSTVTTFRDVGDDTYQPRVEFSYPTQSYEPEPTHEPSGELCDYCGAPMGNSSICDYCGRRN